MGYYKKTDNQAIKPKLYDYEDRQANLKIMAKIWLKTTKKEK